MVVMSYVEGVVVNASSLELIQYLCVVRVSRRECIALILEFCQGRVERIPILPELVFFLI
jgi:hypothetical protein